MDEAHPIVGVAFALFFLVLGFLMVTVPDRIQRLANRSAQRGISRHLPFAGFADSTLYMPSLRVGGWVLVSFGIFFLIIALLML